MIINVYVCIALAISFVIFSPLRLLGEIIKTTVGVVYRVYYVYAIGLFWKLLLVLGWW